MQKLRIGLLVFAVAVIILQLIIIDYHDLSWAKNTGSYLTILAMIFVILGLTLSVKYDKKDDHKLD